MISASGSSVSPPLTDQSTSRDITVPLSAVSVKLACPCTAILVEFGLKVEWSCRLKGDGSPGTSDNPSPSSRDNPPRNPIGLLDFTKPQGLLGTPTPTEPPVKLTSTPVIGRD